MQLSYWSVFIVIVTIWGSLLMAGLIWVLQNGLYTLVIAAGIYLCYYT